MLLPVKTRALLIIASFLYTEHVESSQFKCRACTPTMLRMIFHWSIFHRPWRILSVLVTTTLRVIGSPGHYVVSRQVPGHVPIRRRPCTHRDCALKWSNACAIQVPQAHCLAIVLLDRDAWQCERLTDSITLNVSMHGPSSTYTV